MANLLKPTLDQMVFRQHHLPGGECFHRLHPVLVDETPSEGVSRDVSARLGALVPVLTAMVLMFAIGDFVITLIELAGLEFRLALKPVSGMNEFLNADALGRTLRVQTMSFARACIRLPG